MFHAQIKFKGLYMIYTNIGWSEVHSPAGAEAVWELTDYSGKSIFLLTDWGKTGSYLMEKIFSGFYCNVLQMHCLKMSYRLSKWKDGLIVAVVTIKLMFTVFYQLKSLVSPVRWQEIEHWNVLRLACWTDNMIC